MNKVFRERAKKILKAYRQGVFGPTEVREELRVAFIRAFGYFPRRWMQVLNQKGFY